MKIILPIFIILFSSILYLDLSKIKEKKIEKIKTDHALEYLFEKYEWKTKRLKVYTGLVYDEINKK